MKELKKIKLKKDASILTNEEMKNIKGAKSIVQGCDNSCTGSCSVNLNGMTISGTCTWGDASGYLACTCRIY